MKLPGHRPGLPGKVLSFILCPLAPSILPRRDGAKGHVPAKRVFKQSGV